MLPPRPFETEAASARAVARVADGTGGENRMPSQASCVMLSAVGAVSYDDDSILRFVVCRYAYDPLRHERRHIVVAVVDNYAEFKNLLNRLGNELSRRRTAGENVDPREHISGQELEPGYLARSASSRLLRRAIRHGAWSERLQALEVPINTAVLRVEQ